jgi:isoquinoline 1-oxidoreductase alpha subunit
MERNLQLTVNGREFRLTTEEDRSLLDVLREDLQLTGTKYGCGEGECGACTVLIDGEATRSCLTSVSEVQNRSVHTIEGLAVDGALHPVQQAFLDQQAMQCGYCVPGQILSAVSLLNKTSKPSRDEIIQHMNGNLCRCCNYPRILAAIEQAAGHV